MSVTTTVGSHPRVSVLLSVHNGRPYLPAAVESVLGQGFTDFEFVIIDDASDDGSWQYLSGLRDRRLRLYRNPDRAGLTRSLNTGLGLVRGEYVARMDADDISEPDRLRRQVEFLHTRPEIGILGTSRLLIDEAGALVSIAVAPADDLAVRWKCLLGNPFAHSTVMIRRSVLETNRLRYDETFRTAQDYELWSRLLARTCGANLTEPLLRYRLRDGVSRLNKVEQLRNHDRIAFAAVHRLVPGLDLTPDDVAQLRGRYGGFSVRDDAADPADPAWQAKYARLLDAFASSRAGEPNLDLFRREQLDRLARLKPPVSAAAAG